MNIVIMVSANRDWEASVEHVGLLVEQLQLAGCRVAMVFFYGRSVAVGCRSERRWRELGKHVPLVLCRTMVEYYQVDEAQIDDCFQVGGMASWMQAVEQSDRCIEVS